MKRSAAIVTGICVVLTTWRRIAIARICSLTGAGFTICPYFRWDSILLGAALVLWLVSSPVTSEKSAAPQLLVVVFAFGSWPRSCRVPPQSASRTVHALPALSLCSAHSGREEIFPHHQERDTSASAGL